MIETSSYPSESFPKRGWFIAGTDTEVGKTYVACRVIRSITDVGISVAAYKPVASGSELPEQSDASKLHQATGLLGTLQDVNPQFFRAPLAPPMAAESEGAQIDEVLIFEGAKRWTGRCDGLVVEGAGGLLSPVSWNLTNADVARVLGYPLILVAANRLGVVNHTLMTVEVAKAHGLRIACIVLNDSTPSTDDQSRLSNARLLTRFMSVRHISIPVVRLALKAERFEPAIDFSKFGA